MKLQQSVHLVWQIICTSNLSALAGDYVHLIVQRALGICSIYISKIHGFFSPRMLLAHKSRWLAENKIVVFVVIV